MVEEALEAQVIDLSMQLGNKVDYMSSAVTGAVKSWGEQSTNAGDAFAAGVKGRWREATQYEEHSCLGQVITLDVPVEGKLCPTDIPTRLAVNEVLRQEYATDCRGVTRRWNAVIDELDFDFQFELPNVRFFRRKGLYANHHFAPDGSMITKAEWEGSRDRWLPTPEDQAFVDNLMHPCLTPGSVANWIAPPKRGINGMPTDFQYVRLV